MVELKLEKAFNFLKDRSEHVYLIYEVCNAHLFFILNLIYKYFVIFKWEGNLMKPIKIGIAGLGNVGEEVAYQLIKGFRVQKNLFQIELVAV